MYGTTSLLGTRICERLKAEGQPVRALIRRTSNPDKVNALRSLGCEWVTGDLKDPPQIQVEVQEFTSLAASPGSGPESNAKRAWPDNISQRLLI
jgi:uncharacterized protein YbjT (DUF2867 family)